MSSQFVLIYLIVTVTYAAIIDERTNLPALQESLHSTLEDRPPAPPFRPETFQQRFDFIAANIISKIDLIHDTDHGVRICNREVSADQGVCFGSAKCRALNGIPTGERCQAVTPKTTCCKFERTCSEETVQTVTHFKVHI
jgi:hypothetical protein